MKPAHPRRSVCLRIASFRFWNRVSCRTTDFAGNQELVPPFRPSQVHRRLIVASYVPWSKLQQHMIPLGFFASKSPEGDHPEGTGRLTTAHLGPSLNARLRSVSCPGSADMNSCLAVDRTGPRGCGPGLLRSLHHG